MEGGLQCNEKNHLIPPSGSTELPSGEMFMETRAERLKRAIEELKQIDLEVLFPVGELSANDRAEEDRLLFELKGLVDELRTSIWCRFKAAASPDEDASKMIDFYRMRRVVQMLRQIRTSERKVARVANFTSHLKDMEELAGAAVQEHCVPSGNVN
jgi:hypothetical protein